MLVQPDTVIRWHRTAWRRYWTWKSRKRGPGRPRIDRTLRELIGQMVRENPRWGIERIVGELRALGYDVSGRTVARYRRLARRRPPSQTWRTFLRNHAPEIWAVDLFTVQTLTLRTLYAIVFIAHGRRRIIHINVTEHPTAQWIWQHVIEATPWGAKPRYLIRDHDRSYGKAFIKRAADIGIATIVTPMHAPNANAVAERVIGTLRRECLDHVIVLNSICCVRFTTSSTITGCAHIGRSRSTRPADDHRCPPRSMAAPSVGPRSEAYITNTSGRREFCHPTGADRDRCAPFATQR